MLQLQPPGTLHQTAAGIPDRVTKEMHSLDVLLKPVNEEEEAAAIMATAEAEAEAVLQAAERAASPDAADEGAKAKKKSAKEQAAEAEAVAARQREAEERAEAIRAAAVAEVEERKRTRVNWLDLLEERAMPYEWTPLMYAARHGCCDDMMKLIRAGANIHVRDLHGCTPLHKAAYVGGADGVAKIKALVAAGADLEAADKCGRRALHVAALNEQVEAIKYLSRLGASQMARDGPLKDGDTPIQVAKAAGLQLSVDVLKPWQTRIKRLTGGATVLVPANTPHWVPGPFSHRRFNVNGTWEPPGIEDH